MRALALLILLLAQEPDIDGLLKQLEDESIEVRDKAASKLIGLGDAAEQKINARLATAEGEFKARLKSVLRDIGKARKLNSVFPKTRRVSLDFKDAPLNEVLDRLKMEAGVLVDAGSAGDRKVTVKIADVFPLEALDAVCRSADVEFLPRPVQGLSRSNVAANAESIVLRPGYTRTPRVFAGPFVVSVPSVLLNTSIPPGSGLKVSMSVYWSPGFRPSKLVDFDFTSARDDKGNDLRQSMSFMDGRWESLAGVLPRPLEAQLLDPAPDAKKLSLKGRGTLVFPLDQAVLAFKSPGDCIGQERATDQISIRLESSTLGGGSADFRVKVTQKGDAGRQNGIHSKHFSPGNVRLVTADGQKHPNKSWTASEIVTGGMTVELKWDRLKSDVTALEFVFDSEMHRADFEFELKDIPLPK